MKIVKWIVIGLLLLVFIAVGIVWLNLNGIVRSTVESQASQQLGVATTLGSARVSIFGGSLSLGDLAIASPKGFDAPHMFGFKGTDVSVKLGQLTNKPIHISSINVNKPALVIERQNLTLNFKKLVDDMPVSTAPADPKSEPVRLIIDHMTINNASVIIRPGNLPGIKIPSEISLTLPTFTIENIGNADGAQNGAAIREVILKCITALVSQATQSDQLPPELKDLLSLDLNNISAKLGAEFKNQLDKTLSGVTKGLSGQIGGALGNSQATSQPAKAVEDGVKGVLNGLGGKKKKD